MIYPLIPEFLVSLGANKSIIGLIEGIAESIASLFRAVFGRLSDKIKKRKLFVFLGYGLSAFSKPFLYLAGHFVPCRALDNGFNSPFFGTDGKGNPHPGEGCLDFYLGF
jgi:hypothetical protein